jgi:hypothetical protein
MKDAVQSTLAEREKTHGNFTDNAKVMQGLKDVCHMSPNWIRMSYVQREAIDMICHKLGRILSGDPSHPDHWLDIQGYARCAWERLPKP